MEYYASSCPVNQFRFGDFYDVIGNVWQWTETPITGFAGFEVHPYYDDFSTPTFDGLHNLIKGGSWISTGNEATRDSRYAFGRHFFQHAGLRYVESDQPVCIQVDVYETDRSVAQYCESHYGEKYFGVENFPEAMSRLCFELMRDRPRNKALESLPDLNSPKQPEVQLPRPDGDREGDSESTQVRDDQRDTPKNKRMGRDSNPRRICTLSSFQG